MFVKCLSSVCQVSSVCHVFVECLSSVCQVFVKFIADDGANGWCIGFKPATRIKRWIFFTAAFERLHGEAVAMLKHAVALAHSRWNLDDDIARWRKLFLTAKRNKKSAEVVLLASKREVKTFKCAKVTVQIWTLHSFSTMLEGKSIDAERTF